MSARRLRSVPVLAVLLLLAGTGEVAAQQLDRPAGQEQRLSPETIETLRAITRRAQRAGVPPELLRRKVNEGVSKGVSGERLERAIAEYAGRLAAARRLAGSDAGPDVLAAAAEAVERGLPPDRVRTFVTANRNPLRSVVGLRALVELHDTGVPADEAARGVSAALDRGLRGERLLALSAAVRRRVAAGEDPTVALRAEVDGGRSPVSSRRTPRRRD